MHVSIPEPIEVAGNRQLGRVITLTRPWRHTETVYQNILKWNMKVHDSFWEAVCHKSAVVALPCRKLEARLICGYVPVTVSLTALAPETNAFWDVPLWMLAAMVERHFKDSVPSFVEDGNRTNIFPMFGGVAEIELLSPGSNGSKAVWGLSWREWTDGAACAYSNFFKPH